MYVSDASMEPFFGGTFVPHPGRDTRLLMHHCIYDSTRRNLACGGNTYTNATPSVTNEAYLLCTYPVDR
jgi:hypothetical protein